MKISLRRIFKALIVIALFFFFFGGITSCAQQCPLNFGKTKSFGRLFLMIPSDSNAIHCEKMDDENAVIFSVSD